MNTIRDLWWLWYAMVCLDSVLFVYRYLRGLTSLSDKVRVGPR